MSGRRDRDRGHKSKIKMRSGEDETISNQSCSSPNRRTTSRAIKGIITLTYCHTSVCEALVDRLALPGFHLETGLDDVGRSRQIRRRHATSSAGSSFGEMNESASLPDQRQQYVKIMSAPAKRI